MAFLTGIFTLALPIQFEADQPFDLSSKFLCFVDAVVAGLDHDAHQLLVLGFEVMNSLLVHPHLLLQVLDAGSEVLDGLGVHNGYI